MVYLSFDLGLAHTGVAISHEGSLSEGLTTIEETDRLKLFQKILALIVDHQPDVVILGQPAYGPIQKLAENLINFLQPQTNAKIVLHSEDLSTRDAQRLLLESQATLHHRRTAEHQIAAAHLLQDYLDTL